MISLIIIVPRIVFDQLSSEFSGSGYSFKSVEPMSVIQYDGESEFSRAVNGMNLPDVMATMDDLMNTLSVINPKLYAAVLRNLQP